MVEPTRVTRKKCGKIFSWGNDIFSFICEFCEEKCQELEDLRAHLTEHFPEFPTIIKKEDSICCESDRECKLVEIEDDDVKYNLIDPLKGNDDSQSSEAHEDSSPRDEENINSELKLNDVTTASENETTDDESDENNGKNPERSIRRNDAAKKEALATANVSHQFHCGICQLSFKRKDHIQRHMGKHTSERPYKCKICSKSFSLKYILSRHLNTHTSKMSHECKVCSKRFSLKDSLTRHMKLHTGKKPFKCDICSKDFSHKPDLGRHMQTHSGAKPHKCEMCNKRFSRKAVAIRHMRTHTGERPHKCDICGQSFSRKELVILHMFAHTGEKKPFKCNVCSKSFSQKSYLGTHMQNHTSNPNKYTIKNKLSREYNLRRNVKIHT